MPHPSPWQKAGAPPSIAGPAAAFCPEFFVKGFWETLFYKKGFPKVPPRRKDTPHA